MSKKPKISVEVTTEEYDLLRKQAKERQVTVSELVREALWPRTPTSEGQRAMAGAFQALDASDQLQGIAVPSDIPRPATRAATVGITAVMPQGREIGLNEHHACVYLKLYYPPNYSAADCQGSCGHPRQQGKACFWATAVADSCPAFLSRKKTA